MLTRRALTVPALLGALAVLLQVAYPLVHGPARDRLTVLTVLVLCAATVSHAAATRGPVWAARLLLTATGVGLAAEAVGVATGVPFGDYAYTGHLGPRLLGVPLVVPLAWAMLAHPCLLLGRRLASGPAAVVLSALALTGWDLFLDPQMVAAHQWTWASPSPGLNGIPWTNTAGWLAVSLLLMALLSRLPDERDHDDRLPAALLLWTWVSGVVAAAAFFGTPGVALAGGLGMGAVVLPYARSLAA
ncbi:MAG: carotenoid biosynthesis protein [Mycobacteriales bacterium]